MSIKTLITNEMIDKYTKKTYWGYENILYNLKKNSDLFGEKVAFIENDNRFNFNEMYNNINKVAINFKKLGIKKETIVGVQLPNCVELIYCYYALSQIGAITLPINSANRKNELDEVIKLFDVEYLVGIEEYRKFNFLDLYKQIKNENNKIKNIIIVGNDDYDNFIQFNKFLQDTDYNINDISYDEIKLNDVNSIFTTSGTTGGQYKGVMWTLNNLTFNARAFNESYMMSHDDVVLFLAPFTHISFVLALNAFNLLGITLITEINQNTNKALDIIEKEGVTVLMSVPALYSRMLDDPEFKNKDISSLKKLISFGAAVPPNLISNVRKYMCNFNIWYGTTEGGFCTSKQGMTLESLQNTVGNPQRGAEFVIKDMDNNDLPNGIEGEICINGPVRSAGYYNNDELNKKSFDEDGYFHTGDLGYYDDDLNLHVTGRIKDLIIRGGENILPLEIEKVLVQHNKIKDSAVIGMPDNELGERVCAYVQCEEYENITLDDIKDYLKEKGLAYYKIPERLEIVNDFPRSQYGGKIVKSHLQEDITKKINNENNK